MESQELSKGKNIKPTDKTKKKNNQEYGAWFCAVCGESNLAGGIIRNISKTQAIYGRCHYCGPKVLVKRALIKKDDN